MRREGGGGYYTDMVGSALETMRFFFADYYKYPLIPLGFSCKIRKTQGHLSVAAHFFGWNLQSGNRHRKAAVVIFAQETDFKYAGAFVMRQ